MAKKLLSLLGILRSADDSVIEARFTALGTVPPRRNRRRTVSPFKFVARAAV